MIQKPCRETLQASAIVGKLTDTVKNHVNNLLANSVMATREVVGSILLSCDQLLGMEKLAVGTSPHFVNDSGFQVDHHTTGHMLASTCLGKEGVESVITATNCFITGHLAIWLDTVLEAKKLPASIANLDAALSKVEAEHLTHDYKEKVERRGRMSECGGGLSRNETDQIA